MNDVNTNEEYCVVGIQTLAGIARNSTSDAARVSAAQALLDRGWGKAPQPHTGEDDEDIRVTGPTSQRPRVQRSVSKRPVQSEGQPCGSRQSVRS